MKRRDDFSWHSSNSYYCEEHRKLRETYWKIVRNYDTNPESYSSSHDGQLTNDASSDRRRSIVEQNRDSPVASCLKAVGSRKKSEVKKRVNFYKEKSETTSYTSSSYYRLPQNNNRSSRRPTSHRSTTNDDESCNNSVTDLYDLRCSSSSGSPGHPRADVTPSRKSSRTDDSSNEERRLLERLSGLSLHSSSGVTCCSPRKKPEPRLYRPKDCLKRAAVRRMFVYPPEGQTGPPLTLRRSSSSIDCHVSGDPSNGYRYKVYYLQKFESDTWFPDDKTGGPFRRLEDDCSTDYG